LTKANYKYAGLIASTWDLWRDTTSRWDDSILFLDIVRQYGQPALDIGCSTGRIVLDYLAQGIDIDGVDISPEMVTICRDKAQQMRLSPNLYVQAMEALDSTARWG
jgi:SAM-dependent methyltransferase